MPYGKRLNTCGGVLQLYDVLQNGYWHARSAVFGHSPMMNVLEWARLPGDLVFIVLGVVPLVIAAIRTYFGLYMMPALVPTADAAAETV